MNLNQLLLDFAADVETARIRLNTEIQTIQAERIRLPAWRAMQCLLDAQALLEMAANRALHRMSEND